MDCEQGCVTVLSCILEYPEDEVSKFAQNFVIIYTTTNVTSHLYIIV